MQHVVALTLGFRVQLGDALFLLVVVIASFDHMGQFALFSGDFGLYLPVWLIEIGNIAIRIYVQLRQRHIQSNVPQLLLVLGRYRSRFLLRVLKQQREIPLTCGFVGHRYTFQKAAGLHLPMQAKANGLLDFGQFKQTPIQENVWVLLICQICCIRIC